MSSRQRTLQSEIRFDGVGVHSGSRVEVRLLPAPANAGVTFVRTDLDTKAVIPASAKHVVETRLATTLGTLDSPHARVGTVEHLIAAVAGIGVDNLRIEIDGPEVPILDGSSAPFVSMMLEAGLVELAEARRVVVVRRPVEARDGEKRAVLLPSLDAQLHVQLAIDFDHPAIGHQQWEGVITPATFAGELAAARTFGFLRDVERLKAAGLARGGSLENAVVLDDERVLNPEGLRFSDEFVRHKVLDAVGDLALAGYPMSARLVAQRSGHELNAQLVHALLADERNYAVVPAEEAPRVRISA